MHKILTIFLVALFITSAHSYFFNIEHFLKPVTDPNAKIFGSAIGHDSRRNFDFIIPIDDRGKQNLRINNQVEKDLYKALGVPEDVVINRILPVHTKVKANVEKYFYFFGLTKLQLYNTIVELKNTVDWLTRTYFQKFNNVILGDNNHIKGRNIYVVGGGHKIIGTSNIIMSPQYSDRIVSGSNIIRTSRFDIYMDNIQQILKNPFNCIRLLDFEL